MNKKFVYQVGNNKKVRDNMLATISLAESLPASFFKLQFYHGTSVSESSNSTILYDL